MYCFNDWTFGQLLLFGSLGFVNMQNLKDCLANASEQSQILLYVLYCFSHSHKIYFAWPMCLVQRSPFVSEGTHLIQSNLHALPTLGFVPRV